MNFEDIVDMEWVDSHTTLDETQEFNNLYFDQQPDFLLEQPITPPQQPMVEPEIKMEPLIAMPTTEQIKQLIEIAKQQLALREQLQLLQQQTTPTSQPLFHALTETELTAAPSTIFAPVSNSNTTPSMPGLSPSMISSTDMLLVPPMTLNETVNSNQQSLSINSQHSSVTSTRRDSLASMQEESISLEAYAEADGIDLKKLTPKERRQLRNKISARNFRVRRKEYISTLEGQVNDHKMKAEELKEKLLAVEDENKKLRKEMDSLKRQNQLLQQQQQFIHQKNNPSSSPRLSKPNLNKDLSIMGTKPTDSYRQDNCIMVSNAIMPVWDYESILSKDIEPLNDNQSTQLNKLAGQFILSVVQLARNIPSNQEEHKLPLMPDDRDFTSSNLMNEKLSTYNSTASNSHSSIEDLYDNLIQSALLNNSSADKSFLW